MILSVLYDTIKRMGAQHDVAKHSPSKKTGEHKFFITMVVDLEKLFGNTYTMEELPVEVSYSEGTAF